MSGAGTRVPLEDAEYIAGELKAELVDYCSRIVIAGSIRRRSTTCGDIDLVCEPTTEPLLDMFGQEAGESLDHLDEGCTYLLGQGVLSQRLDANGRPSWGTRLKRAIYGGMAVDIQAVHDADTWGAWLLIRTGPAEFNKRLVTPRRQGGWLPAGFQFKDGFQLWAWDERIPTPTERSVFDALGLGYREPWDRG